MSGPIFTAEQIAEASRTRWLNYNAVIDSHEALRARVEALTAALADVIAVADRDTEVFRRARALLAGAP